MFDKLLNLEKQHDVHTKTHTSIIVPDEDAPASTPQNPIIPSHAIVFKKRPADDDSFARPSDKWQKYDLEDVNEHHLGGAGNRHALNDFFRTRVKPAEPTVAEEPVEAAPVFKRPMKKEILSHLDDDDDVHQEQVAFRVPLPPATAQKSTAHQTTDDSQDDEINAYRLKSTQKKTRGVSSTTKKPVTKVPMEISSSSKDKEDLDDDDDDEVDDELFEP